MKSKNIPESPAALSPAHTPLTAKILVRGIHLELTAALRDAAVEKSARLLRHNDAIVRVRVDLEHDHTKGDRAAFLAKGHVEIAGPDLIASVASDDAYKSLDLLVDKLDRMLRERSRHRTDRRNNGTSDGKFRRELATED